MAIQLDSIKYKDLIDMEFKGTKGRWNLGYKTVKVNEASILFMPIYKTVMSNKIIAVAYSEHGIESEVKSNALLISKAPEMLEMLKSFVYDFDNGLIDDFQIPRDRFESLINSIITE